MTTCITFTCTKDLIRARFHASALPREWKKLWVVETLPEKENADELCRELENFSCIVKAFDRGKTLRGVPAILGMRDVFIYALKSNPECSVFVKLDSDTHLFEPRAFTAPIIFSGADFVYVRRLCVESRLLANGCCYAMSARAVERLEHLSPPFPKNYSGHEDLVFSAFFTTRQRDLCLCQIPKIRWSWCEHPLISKLSIGAHNGYVPFEKDVEIVSAIERERNRR